MTSDAIITLNGSITDNLRSACNTLTTLSVQAFIEITITSELSLEAPKYWPGWEIIPPVLLHSRRRINT